jgi:hypothetical protein
MTLTLLPIPRQLEYFDGNLTLSDNALIVISDRRLLFEAQMVQRTLLAFGGVAWPIVAGKDYGNAGLRLTIDEHQKFAQGYLLTITDGQISIIGADAAGVFYGVCTLRQIMQQSGRVLPSMSITDWPDFPVRGVMLDISRDKVPTMQTVLDLLERLATWKINQVQLYMEHTFAYQAHPEVWVNASPFTGQEILELDTFCRERHIDLVPNQNSLGHMERWLKLSRYLPLAETPDGFIAAWGERRAASTLNPIDPQSLQLVESLYEELLPHFSSSLFNVGCDEPWELGQGKSKAEVEARGAGRVYLDYLLKLYDMVTARSRQMQFWGDIIIHHPELVPELPKDLIAMEWGYEADHPFEEHGGLFAKSGVPFYVCAGTSTWNSLAGRTDNAIKNLLNAATNGLKHGAIGYLITDWGDNGHLQPLPASYLPFAFAAALSWALDANQSLDLPRAGDLFAFDDSTGIMGQLAYDLGNIYALPGLARFNGSVLFDVLQAPASLIKERLTGGFAEVTPDRVNLAKAHISDIMRQLESANIQRPDAALIQDEFWQAAELMRHACDRLLWVMGKSALSKAELLADLERLVEKQRENWLARNRPGGLDDSIAQFDTALNEYRA